MTGCPVIRAIITDINEPEDTRIPDRQYYQGYSQNEWIQLDAYWNGF